MHVVQSSNAIHPILLVMAEQGRRHTWLAKTTGYRPEYLSRIFHKRLPATVRVRAACAKALGLPELVLFHVSPTDPTAEEAA
jgi:hypothetical protein